MTSQEPLVTIVSPVYDHPLAYLEEAARSVMAQEDGRWRWLLADDHSRDDVRAWTEAMAADPRVSVLRQERNVGLFANMNAALRRVATPYVLLLCTDDRLRPGAVSSLLAGVERFPHADLVLSSCDAIDDEGRPIPSDYAVYRASMAGTTRLMGRREGVESTLRFGSFNGNLTAMFFRRSLVDRAGPFREDWTHCGDWEWLYRAAKAGAILLSLDCVAELRSHTGQLSGANLRAGAVSREVAQMVRTLLADPVIREHPQARRWAIHVMQYQAWTAGRMALRGEWRLAREILADVDRTTGLVPTLGEMLRRLPARIEGRVRGRPQMPPI